MHYVDGNGSSICNSTSIGGMAYAPSQCNKNIIRFYGGEANGGGITLSASVFDCATIRLFDVKYDDGKPYTGKVQIAESNYIGGGCQSGGWPDGAYTNSGNAFIIFLPLFQ